MISGATVTHSDQYHICELFGTPTYVAAVNNGYQYLTTKGMSEMTYAFVRHWRKSATREQFRSVSRGRTETSVREWWKMLRSRQAVSLSGTELEVLIQSPNEYITTEVNSSWLFDCIVENDGDVSMTDGNGLDWNGLDGLRFVGPLEQTTDSFYSNRRGCVRPLS